MVYLRILNLRQKMQRGESNTQINVRYILKSVWTRKVGTAWEQSEPHLGSNGNAPNKNQV